MRVIGDFRELHPRENPSLVSIHSLLGELPEAITDRVADYLDRGIPVLDVMGETHDPLNPSIFVTGGPSLFSDGYWIWRHDLSHFVRAYRVGLPDAFVAQAVAGKPIIEDDGFVARIIDEVLHLTGWL